MIRIRESFGAKLLSTLFGTVALLTTVTFVIVRLQMNSAVDGVEERTINAAGTLFNELNELQLEQVVRLARPFMESRRSLANMDVAISSGEVADLASLVDYEMELARVEDELVVFTDHEGTPVLTVLGGRRITEGDLADIRPVARQLLNSEEGFETTGYRVVEGRMYRIRVLYAELGFRAIGTITFGLPIEDADVDRIGRVAGVEACIYADGACVIQTPGVDEQLGAALLAAAGSTETVRVDVASGEYLLRSEDLVATDPQQGARIVAAPLDPVLSPFQGIQRALLFGGGGALLLSALIGAALSRSLTQPIRDLVVAVGRVAEGDFEAEVSVDSSDEMGTLASAFNEMTHGLLRRERERAVLDKVVSQEVADELLKGDVELGGENREVSVLFADIRGFTPMTQGMEPQDVIAFLNDCMERLSIAVDAEGGVVDKFIGDELMAVFGAPARHENHAMRAVRSALSMQEGIEQLNERRAARGVPRVRVGIGINSGVAVAGNMGSTDRLNYTVLGETVNLAARLVDRAEPGQILISEETLRQAGDGVVAPCVGTAELKGFSDEVRVYELESCGDPTRRFPGLRATPAQDA